MPVAAFSPRKHAIVIYRMNNFPEANELIAKLGKCTVQGTCLHIKDLADIDLKVLQKMIVKSIGAARQDFQAES
jgi:hypothetical protein